MSYKQYMRSTRKITEAPIVTIGSSGNLYLNTFVMRNYLNGVKYVILLIDNERKCFAIKAVKERQEGAYILGFSSLKNKSTGFVAARGFVNLPLLQKTKGKQLKAVWNEKEKILEIEL